MRPSRPAARAPQDEEVSASNASESLILRCEPKASLEGRTALAPRSALQTAPAPAKARITFQSDNGPAPMIAIGIIALFLVVILGLNKFEFGRFD